MNYYGDPHDMEVMVAVLRRALDVVAHWPGEQELGPLLVPPALAAKHGHAAGRHPERRPARGPGPALLVHRVPPDVDVPDGQRRRPAAAGDGRRRPAGRRRQRHAQRGQRQHQRRRDHDRREGGLRCSTDSSPTTGALRPTECPAYGQGVATHVLGDDLSAPPSPAWRSSNSSQPLPAAPDLHPECSGLVRREKGSISLAAGHRRGSCGRAHPGDVLSRLCEPARRHGHVVSRPRGHGHRRLPDEYFLAVDDEGDATGSAGRRPVRTGAQCSGP